MYLPHDADSCVHYSRDIVLVHLWIGVIIRARRPRDRISLLPPKEESKANVQVGHIVLSLLLMRSNYFQHEPRP